MKLVILASLLSMVSAPAFATQLCGKVSSYSFGPDCKPTEICPQWMGIGYEMTSVTGDVEKLSADTSAVLQDFEQDEGQTICVEGKQAAGSPESFQVDQVDAFAPRGTVAALAEKAVAPQVSQWASGQTSLTISGASATIQFTCGDVTIEDWHVDGKAMHGEDHPGPVSVGKGSPIRVTANQQKDGTLRVQVGTKAAAGTYVFKQGAPTSIGLRCL